MIDNFGMHVNPYGLGICLQRIFRTLFLQWLKLFIALVFNHQAEALFLRFIDDCAKVLEAVSVPLFNLGRTQGLLYVLTTYWSKVAGFK